MLLKELLSLLSEVRSFGDTLSQGLLRLLYLFDLFVSRFAHCCPSQCFNSPVLSGVPRNVGNTTKRSSGMKGSVGLLDRKTGRAPTKKAARQ